MVSLGDYIGDDASNDFMAGLEFDHEGARFRALNWHDVPTYKHDTRSFSQLQTYAKCSEQYRLQKVEHVPEQMTAWAPQGSAFHTGMEEWEKSGRALTVDEVIDLALADYDQRIARQREKQPEDSGWLTGGRTKAKDDIARRRDRVVEHVKGYVAYSLDHEHEFRPAELPDGRPAVEVPWTITLNGVTVVGYTDLVLWWPERNMLTIRDLKTGNKLPDGPEQLAVYGIAWEHYFGDRIEYGDYFMCKNNAPTQPYYLGDYPEPVIGAWFEMMHRAERSGIYLPNRSDACRVCTVAAYCSAGGAEKQAYMMPTMREKGNQ